MGHLKGFPSRSENIAFSLAAFPISRSKKPGMNPGFFANNRREDIVFKLLNLTNINLYDRLLSSLTKTKNKVFNNSRRNHYGITTKYKYKYNYTK